MYLKCKLKLSRIVLIIIEVVIVRPVEAGREDRVCKASLLSTDVLDHLSC